MRQFVVPQFIQVENKVIGFITVRQFTLLLGALFISIAFYKFADVTLFIFITVMDFAVAGVFGWVKINGRPIHYFFIKSSLFGIIQTINMQNSYRIDRHLHHLNDSIIRVLG